MITHNVLVNLGTFYC